MHFAYVRCWAGFARNRGLDRRDRKAPISQHVRASSRYGTLTRVESAVVVDEGATA